jgi:predicted transcriptional regulator
MSRNFDCCAPTTSIEQALEQMQEQRARRLLVVGDNKQPLGLITLVGIARCVEALAGDRQARGLFLLGRALAAVDSP